MNGSNGSYDYRGLREMQVKDLIGMTLTKFQVLDNKEEIHLTSDDGRQFKFFHDRDCCESVEVNEIHGDLSDLVGTPILNADESSNSDGEPPSEYSDSWTWTFYRFTTIKGTVVIRWLGESNGYYSESVELVEINPESEES